MPRLVSVFSIPDLGWLEEPVTYKAGFPIRVRAVAFGLGGVFAAFMLQLPSLGARAAIAAAGVALGAVPVKPPLSRLLARREPAGELVYWAPAGSIVIYVAVPEAGELVVEVDGKEYDRLSVDAGLARIEVAGLQPGEHVVRVVQSGRVLRELRILSGERRGRSIKAEAEAREA